MPLPNQGSRQQPGSRPVPSSPVDRFARDRWASMCGDPAQEPPLDWIQGVEAGWNERVRLNGYPTKFPWIKGRCPACKGMTLFVGSGGYVTCSWVECSNPSAAHDLLVGR